MDNTKECFIRREETRTSCKSVPLHHTLTSVLGKNFDDTTTGSTGGFVPLEVTARIFEDGVQLI